MAEKTNYVLTRDEIMASQDIEETFVPVPKWGIAPDGKPKGVTIRTFSKRQTDKMRKDATVKDRAGKETLDAEKLEALLFVEGVVEPKFTVEDYTDMMQDKSAIAVGSILKAIMEASGLSELAVAEASKSVERG